MIGQIGYLGKVSPRTGLTAALMYALGATLGAALVGLALGCAGAGARWLLGLDSAPHAPWTLLPVAGLALVGGLRDLGLLRFRLLQPARQVPRGWMTVFGPRKTGFLWGLAIGLAYSTMVQYSLYYVLAAWVLAEGQPVLGAAALATYGATQGALLVAEVALMARDPRRDAGLLGARRSEAFFRLSGGVLAASAVILLRVGTASGPVRYAHAAPAKAPRAGLATALTAASAGTGMSEHAKR